MKRKLIVLNHQTGTVIIFDAPKMQDHNIDEFISKKDLPHNDCSYMITENLQIDFR